jgi:hypothetical protein
MKNKKTGIIITSIISAICSLITLIYYAAGVGVTGTYNGKASGSWGMSLLTFGGNDGIMNFAGAGGLIFGFVLAIFALLLSLVILFGSFYPKASKALPIIAIAATIIIFISAILIFNAKNLAVDTSGHKVFVDSAYSATFQLSLGKGAIIGGVFGIIAALTDGIAAYFCYTNK